MRNLILPAIASLMFCSMGLIKGGSYDLGSLAAWVFSSLVCLPFAVLLLVGEDVA